VSQSSRIGNGHPGCGESGKNRLRTPREGDERRPRGADAAEVAANVCGLGLRETRRGRLSQTAAHYLGYSGAAVRACGSGGVRRRREVSASWSKQKFGEVRSEERRVGKEWRRRG